jgi:hypothetical protein
MWTIASVTEIKKQKWNWSKIRMLQHDSQAEIRKIFWIFVYSVFWNLATYISFFLFIFLDWALYIPRVEQLWYILS